MAAESIVFGLGLRPSVYSVISKGENTMNRLQGIAAALLLSFACVDVMNQKRTSRARNRKLKHKPLIENKGIDEHNLPVSLDSSADY